MVSTRSSLSLDYQCPEVPANSSSCRIPVSAYGDRLVRARGRRRRVQASLVARVLARLDRPRSTFIDGGFGCTYRSGQAWRCLQQLPL